MSNNANFYNNFTFQRPPFVQPPPPTYFIPPSNDETSVSTEEIIKTLMQKTAAQSTFRRKNKDISISEVRSKLRNMLLILKDLKLKVNILENNIDTLSEEEWSSTMKKINEYRMLIDQILSDVNGPYLDLLRKLLAKRTAKRLRLKRLKIEKKKEKAEMILESQERSRKINEKLQKIKDEINKARQEEESKIQADIVLREVLRKKQDAKKCIVKLDALVKLRKARLNTAKGRGENVSENDAVTFNSNIEKLKSLWMQRQAVYEKEEAELRDKLKEDSETRTSVNEMERMVHDNLEQWKECLFGGSLPQVDFGGDMGRFIGVRSEWDQYTSSDGMPLPIGWVVPTK